MALGDTVLKKLFQGPLSAAVAAKYTCPVGKQAHVTDIWLDNQNTTTVRNVALYAHGITSANRLTGKIVLSPGTGLVISDNKIILNANEVLAVSQDIGTDVVATVYGYEEDIV